MQLNLKTLFTVLVTTTLIGAFTNHRAYADDSVKKDVKEAGHDTKRAMKKAGRKVHDKTCEMVNGKMSCAGKKLKHGVQNAGDKVEDAVD
jgi:hypothetical protein